MIERADGAPEIRLTQLAKHFRDVRAVDRVSLDIGSGEFFSLLGPSGCGKTTTLRMIGGFELPTAGRIELPRPRRDLRPAGQAAGQHGLPELRAFPHLDVAANISFGLRRPRPEAPAPTAHGPRPEAPAPTAHCPPPDLG
jgi:ABC-type Fe3+/spermidine/putrescine transport system ATPase subunit